jgi:hypothetical protein
MVIRQQVDPYFHCEAQELYDAAMGRRQFTFVKKDRKKTQRQNDEEEDTLYAGANRDEYLGEAMNILLGLCGEEYAQVSITGKSDLEQIDPALCELMSRHFSV